VPRSSEQHCATVLATAMDAIISLDQDHRIKLYNRAAEELLGYIAGRAIGQVFDQFVPARLRGIIRGCLQSADGTRKQRLPTGLAALRADGEEILIEGTLSPVRFNDRVEYTLILRDLQERATVPGSADPLQSLSERPRKSARDGQAFAGVIGEAPAMQAVFEAVRLVAGRTPPC
jgi:formate hydrogenlyase transcriptional activator